MFEWYLSDANNFLFHIVDKQNEVVIGFCGGMYNDLNRPFGSASGMLQHTFDQAVKSMLVRPRLFFHKEMLRKYLFVLRNIRYKIFGFGKQKSNSERPNKEVPHLGLIVVGVLPEYHGRGIGSLLIQKFEDRATEYNVNTLRLTVKASNQQAIKAYMRNGWHKYAQQGESVAMNKTINLDK